MRLSFPRVLFLLPVLALCIGAQTPCCPPDPGYVLVDDMYLPEEAVHGEGGFTATPWPGGVVPYAFDAAVTTTDRERTMTALAELAAVASLTFVPRTSQSNYVTFRNSSGNSSYIGMIGGNQNINMYNWNVRYIICHEVMHALGYVHEQSRPDRNTYVTINSGNITSGTEGNFAISSGATMPGAYDFLSIMHYGQNSFSNGSGPTITCNAAYSSYQSQIGNRSYLSALDAAGLVARYGAAQAPTITQVSPSTLPLSTSTLITVSGTRFTLGSSSALGTPPSRILWNGVPLTTTYVEATGQLTATVSAAQTASGGCFTLRVENPAPGGGQSAAVTVQVGTTACSGLPQFETNSVQATLDFDGVQLGSVYGPAAISTRNAPATGAAHFSTSLVGAPSDTAITLAALVPASSGGFRTGQGQCINLPLSHPSFYFLNSLATYANPLPAPMSWSIPYTATSAPITFSAQSLYLSPTHPDGSWVSQGAQLSIVPFDPCTAGTALTLGDDANVQQSLTAPVFFQGTSYTSVYVGSNGYVTFGAGSTSYNGTAANLRGLAPGICPLFTDLDPGQGGTIRFADAGGGSFGVCFTNIANYGAASSTNSFLLTVTNGSSISIAYGPLASTSGITGVNVGFGSGTATAYDLSEGPFNLPANTVPYQLWTSAPDLSGTTLVITLSATGVPLTIL